jgi:hypothetical protein
LHFVKTILLFLFSLFLCGIYPTQQAFAQKENTEKPKKKGKRKSKSEKGDKQLDTYFYGNKKGKKKGKKGKEEISTGKDKIVDTKSLLKNRVNNNGKKTSGGTGGGTDQVTYRPIYVGNKMVTGNIQSVQGFRICIYTGNNRQEAIATKLSFMKEFNTMRSYMAYGTPYYKIKVGDFPDKKAAQLALKKIIAKFASAFIVPDVVTVKNIVVYKNG